MGFSRSQSDFTESEFPGALCLNRPNLTGFTFSPKLPANDPNFDGRVTVPALWDKVKKMIVNNCEDDICRMFNDAFRGLAQNKEIDLFPRDIAAEQRS